MTRDPHAELLRAAAARDEHDRLRARLAHVEQRRAAKERELPRLAEVLAAERRDVAQLEGLSLRALFHTVLSSKAEQLEKERQEFLAAKLHHDQARSALRSACVEADELRARLTALGDVDAAYAAASAEKERLVRLDGGYAAAALLALTDEVAEKRRYLREVEEVFESGENALDALSSIRKSLSSAQSWGTFDLLGGDLIATAVKHSKIDQARQFVDEAQDALVDFEDQLEDVDFPVELDAQLRDLPKFADFFLDGLIFDWIVQARINKSLDVVVSTHESVGRQLLRLRSELEAARARLAEAEARRAAALEAS